MLGRALRRLFGPMMRKFLSYVDPWESVRYRVPKELIEPSLAYLSAPSTVHIASVDELCAWLSAVEYFPDVDADHPLARDPALFERERRGNCRACSLWAWRKLSELKLNPELVIALWAPPAGEPESHSWVRFAREGRDYVLECTVGDAGEMVRHLDDVRKQYTPIFSLHASGRTRVYRAFARAAWGDHPVPQN